jgi:hypothetical protein
MAPKSGHTITPDAAAEKPAQKPAQPTRTSEQGATAGLLALLNIEAEARKVASFAELYFLIASETRKVTRARQVFVFGAKSGEGVSLEAISGLPAVDRSSPLVITFEKIIDGLRNEGGLTARKEFEFGAYSGNDKEFIASYPFTWLLWLPFLNRRQAVIGGMLLTREQPWTEADIVVGERLSETFAHAIRELSAGRKFDLSWLFGRTTALACCLAVLLLMVVPVSMTVLAPFEVGPKNGFVVSAPIEGIIEEVPVEPNSTVSENEVLVRFNDTVLKNRLEIAEREILVADARLKKATQMAFEDQQGRHELGVLMSELALKTAERDLAMELFERLQVRAPRPGIAVFSDKKQLIGRPVSIGERLMEIANPDEVEAVIEVPVGDAIVLKRGARVKLFLDSDPLRPREAVISLADYLARPRPGNQVAFQVIAQFQDADRPPRLGVRGTAQIYGHKVPLAYYLFRRPLTVLRQWTGL